MSAGLMPLVAEIPPKHSCYRRGEGAATGEGHS